MSYFPLGSVKSHTCFPKFFLRNFGNRYFTALNAKTAIITASESCKSFNTAPGWFSNHTESLLSGAYEAPASKLINSLTKYAKNTDRNTYPPKINTATVFNFFACQILRDTSNSLSRLWLIPKQVRPNLNVFQDACIILEHTEKIFANELRNNHKVVAWINRSSL